MQRTAERISVEKVNILWDVQLEPHVSRLLFRWYSLRWKEPVIEHYGIDKLQSLLFVSVAMLGIIPSASMPLHIHSLASLVLGPLSF